LKLDITDRTVSRLIVTGHPNHELAIFGFVQRMRPRMLFLTDGGGQERVDESRRALASIGLLDHAHFLGWTEQSLYDAVLTRDLGVFGQLVDAVRRELISTAPRQVICESIELYNPLHDIVLPIVRGAARGLDGIEIVEFPLIAQEPSADERYRVQRFPAGRAAVSITLDPAELAIKVDARDRYYATLGRTMEAVLAGVSDEQSGRELFAPATDELPQPGRDHALRYERRARLLHERGEIEQIITLADHFVPVAEALMNAENRLPSFTDRQQR